MGLINLITRIPTFAVKQSICILNIYPRCELVFVTKFGYISNLNNFEYNKQKILYNYKNDISNPELATYKSSLTFFLDLELSCKPISFPEETKYIYKNISIFPYDMFNFIMALDTIRNWFTGSKFKEYYMKTNNGFKLKNSSTYGINIFLGDTNIMFLPVTIYNRNDTTSPGVRIVIPDNRCDQGIFADFSVQSFNAMCYLVKNLDMVGLAQSIENKYGPIFEDYKVTDRRLGIKLKDDLSTTSSESEVGKGKRTTRKKA